MRPPAVSVLIAVHNGAPYLLEALDSVWSQGFTDFEVVVVDDASTDDTASILGEVEDPRLRRIQLERCTGLAGALNAGLEECRAPLVARLDADDRCLADRIEQQVDIMDRRPRLAALGTSAILIDSEGLPTGRRDVPTGSAVVLHRLRWRNALIHPSVMFRREVVQALGGYSSEAGRYEDYELWLRLAALGELDNVGDPLVAYRLHPGQVTSSKVSDPGPMRAVGDVRRALAQSRGESVGVAKWRHRVWITAQRWGDRHRR